MADFYVTGYVPPKGVNSREEVKKIQAVLKIKQDGIWGPQTQAAWEKQYGNLWQRPAAARRDASGQYNLDGELSIGSQDRLKFPEAIGSERARRSVDSAPTAKPTIPQERGPRAVQPPGIPNREALAEANRLAGYQNSRYSPMEFADGSFNHYTYLMQQALAANGATDRVYTRPQESGNLRSGMQRAADVAKGMVPGTTFIDPLQTQITNIGVRPLNPKKPSTIKNQLMEVASGQRLLQIHRGRVRNARGTFVDNVPHMNVEAPMNASVLQNREALVLNHKIIAEPVYEAFKNFDEVTKAVKNGGKALAAIGIALDIYELGSTIYLDLNDEDKKLGKQTLQTSVGIGAGWVGGAAGAKLGAMGGAAIGTFICPGLGTVIGGFIGGIAGGVAGALGARALGEHIVDEAYRGG